MLAQNIFTVLHLLQSAAMLSLLDLVSMIRPAAHLPAGDACCLGTQHVIRMR